MIDESHLPVAEQSLVYRLRRRAQIRRSAQDRLSVVEGRADRIADLLEEAADALDAVAPAQNPTHESGMSAKFQIPPELIPDIKFPAPLRFDGQGEPIAMVSGITATGVVTLEPMAGRSEEELAKIVAIIEGPGPPAFSIGGAGAEP